VIAPLFAVPAFLAVTAAGAAAPAAAPKSAVAVPAAAGPAVPAASRASLRHLEYAVTEKGDGGVSSSRLDVDLTGTTAQHGLTFRIADRVDNVETPDIQASLDRAAGLTVTGEGGFSDREEVLLAIFALSFDNVSGMAKGDKWERVEPAPDGTATTDFEVRGVTGGLVDLAVTHAFAQTYGYTATWKGSVVYDVAASAPKQIGLSGESSLEMKLAADSFTSASK
jgi:hypothetical protein